MGLTPICLMSSLENGPEKPHLIGNSGTESRFGKADYVGRQNAAVNLGRSKIPNYIRYLRRLSQAFPTPGAIPNILTVDHVQAEIPVPDRPYPQLPKSLT
jgi:hypothetical protein